MSIRKLKFLPALAVAMFAMGAALFSTGNANAVLVVTFDGSPGTAAPPPTLGPFTMTPFPDDPTGEFVPVSTLPSPLGGDVTFSPTAVHVTVGVSWASWSHGYAGDVYWTGGGTTMTMTMPPGTSAFYFYAQPNSFGLFNIEAVTDNGTTSGSVVVQGAAGAKYFGFWATGGTLTSITVSLIGGATDFAVGEFGIAGGIPYWDILASEGGGNIYNPNIPAYTPGTWSTKPVILHLKCVSPTGEKTTASGDVNVTFYDGIHSFSTTSQVCKDASGDLAVPVVDYGPIMVDTKAPTCTLSPTNFNLARNQNHVVNFGLTYSDVGLSGIDTVVMSYVASGGAVVNSFGGANDTQFDVFLPNTTAAKVAIKWTITDAAGNVKVCSGNIKAK